VNDTLHYGYIDQNNDNFVFRTKPDQLMSGYPIGIILLNVGYPIVPGNVANATTFDYPVRYVKALKADSPRLHSLDPSLIEDLVEAGVELERDGVRAIICSCGYFGYWQKELVERLNVPVYSSSLMQIPLIKAGLGKDRKIGVLCAVERTFTPELLSRCGVDDPSVCIVKCMEDAPEFSAIPRDRSYMNNAVARREFVQAARELVTEYPQIGAILLECSDMPPYAQAIQEAVNLPVYDFTTMIDWVCSSVRKPPSRGYY
jgi:Asp/Glu/hydantoin racemase